MAPIQGPKIQLPGDVKYGRRATVRGTSRWHGLQEFEESEDIGKSGKIDLNNNLPFAG